MTRPVFATMLLAALALGCKKELVCPTDTAECGGNCVALDGDPSNCGACGRACGALQVCDGGTCACAPDTAACTSGCADLRIDAQHCGTCGTACTGATPVCDGPGGCVASGACSPGKTQCGSSCADLSASPSHCGACGHACAAGQACIAGTCAAPVYAACYWTHEVKPLTRSLRYGGRAIALGSARPFRLAVSGTTLLAAAGQPQASLSFAAVSGTTYSQQLQLPGTDLEGLTLGAGVVLVTNAAVGTLELVTADGTLLDEIPMPDQQSYPNPNGVAVVGTDAYVALNSKNQVVRVDLSSLEACQADTGATACGAGGTCDGGRRCVANLCRLPCATVASVIDLAGVPGLVDGAAQALPSAVAASGGKVYVTISNLAWGHVADCDGYSYDWYSVPAGPGRLAAIDPANADTVSVVNLGPGCQSPSDLVGRGTKLWVSCGSFCFSSIAPGAVVSVDLSGGTPAVGMPIPLGGAVGGALALCGSDGYVADQRKTGAVVRFDPDSAQSASAPVTVCGADANANVLVSDLLCFQ